MKKNKQTEKKSVTLISRRNFLSLSSSSFLFSFFNSTANALTPMGLWAWGLNSSGQLGTGLTTSISTPMQIGLGKWTKISAGASHVVLKGS